MLSVHTHVQVWSAQLGHLRQNEEPGLHRYYKMDYLSTLKKRYHIMCLENGSYGYNYDDVESGLP